MHRIEGPYVGVNSQGNYIFKETPLPPTAVSGDWLTSIQEELAALIEYTGLQLQTSNTDSHDQLRQAIFNRSPFYTTELDEPLFARFQNLNTGYGSTDGTTVGIDVLGNAVLNNYEFKELKLRTHNKDRFKIPVDDRFLFLDTSGNVLELDMQNVSGFKTIDIRADLTVTADSIINQDLTTDATVQHLNLGLGRDMSGDQGQIKLSVYDPAGGGALLMFQDVDTGTNYTDGFHVGIDSTERAIFNNKEATDMLFYTNVLERLRITSDGKLSSGAESAPDVDPGGLTLNQGTGDSNILTFKSSDVAHGMTNQAETDTFIQMRKIAPSSGGSELRGYSELGTGFQIVGSATTPGTTEDSNSYGVVSLVATKKDGTSGNGILSSDENAITMSSAFAVTRWIMKGNGQIYNNYATTMTTYDNENDIELGRALQQKIGGIKISKNMTNKLQDLGIINKEGFACQQTLTALQLGISSQLSNMVRHFAKHIGITENQLLEWSKNYS